VDNHFRVFWQFNEVARYIRKKWTYGDQAAGFELLELLKAPTHAAIRLSCIVIGWGWAFEYQRH